MKRAAVVATLAAAAGCAPTVPALVHARRYDDAICHARTEAEARMVADAIARDADVRLHLYAVHEAEARPVLGDRTTAVLDKITLVRAKVATNELSARVSSSVALLVDGKPLQPAWSSTPPAETAAVLFGLTGERIPGARTVIDGDKLAREAAWGLVTLGMKQLLFGTEKLTYQREPGHDELATSGPKAMSLYDGVRAGAGVGAFFVPRELEQTTRLLVSTRIDTWHEDGGECSWSVDHTASLGQPSRSLVDVVDERFGGDVKRPRDLAMTAKTRLSNPAGGWSW